MMLANRTKIVLMGVALCAGALLCFFLDVPTWQLVKRYVAPAIRSSEVLRQLEDGGEDFATIVPIAIAAWVLWRLDRVRGRQVVVRLLAAIAVATLFSVACKGSVGRHRPEWFPGQTWGQTWIDVGLEHRKAKQQSFFSGHTAAAFAAATVLSAFYPPLKPVVYTVAVGCGAARVTASQHWLSDVYFACLAGIAAGWLFSPGRMRPLSPGDGHAYGSAIRSPASQRL